MSFQIYLSGANLINKSNSYKDMYMIVALHFPGGQACWDIICKHLGLKFQNLNIAFFPFMLKQPVKYIQENEQSIASAGNPKCALQAECLMRYNFSHLNSIKAIRQALAECLLEKLPWSKLTRGPVKTHDIFNKLQ